jgi:hypothetical protein
MNKASMIAQFVFNSLVSYTKEHLLQLLAQGGKIAARDVLAEFLVWCYMNIPGDIVVAATDLAKRRLQQAGLREPEMQEKKPENHN